MGSTASMKFKTFWSFYEFDFGDGLQHRSPPAHVESHNRSCSFQRLDRLTVRHLRDVRVIYSQNTVVHSAERNKNEKLVLRSPRRVLNLLPRVPDHGSLWSKDRHLLGHVHREQLRPGKHEYTTLTNACVHMPSTM